MPISTRLRTALLLFVGIVSVLVADRNGSRSLFFGLVFIKMRSSVN